MPTEQTVETTTEKPSATTQSTQDASTTPTGAGNPGSEAAVSMTQSKFNETIAERIEQAKRALLKELGFASEEEGKTIAQKAREREQAEMSVAERAQKLVDAEKKRADDLEKKLAAERTARRNQTINSGIREAAKNTPDPELVLLWLRQSHAAEVEALLPEEGETLDDKKIKALIETARKEKPLLFSAAPGNPGSPSASGGKSIEADAKLKERGRQSTRRHIKSGF